MNVDSIFWGAIYDFFAAYFGNDGDTIVWGG